MSAASPVEFTKNAPNGRLERVGNSVQIEDADGVAVPSYALANPANLATPAANTAAVVTLAAIPATAHVLSGVMWSYDGDPTGGRLHITAGGVASDVDIDITVGGPGFIPFQPYKQYGINAAVVVTLTAGGAGVTGKVALIGHWTV